MNCHDGVSCNSCMKRNFCGKRYKCLICYDYDLCANCYDSGAISAIHITEHPMQCLLTRSEFTLYYGGEALSSTERPQCYTCPLCGQMGFTESTLKEHVSSEHRDNPLEVVCPICASLPSGEPSLRTDDFAGHLVLEHRFGPNDLISFLDEPVNAHQDVRRIPHSSRGVTSTRSRRSNMQPNSLGGLSYLSSSSRGNVDPIAELLSQLSEVRRSTTNTSVSGTNNPLQLQQLQMQLQLERQQINVARQQFDRLPRRSLETSATVARRSTQTQSSTRHAPVPNLIAKSGAIKDQNVLSQNSKFLLPKLIKERSAEIGAAERHAERAMFVQQLLISTLTQANGQIIKKLKEKDIIKIAEKCTDKNNS